MVKKLFLRWWVVLANLNDNNFFIVSGGAIGGDTYVHQAALKYKIKTGAILGSGLFMLVPKMQQKVV